MAIDPTRLYTALLNTGLQSKDNPLYQVIRDLINALVQISATTAFQSTSIVNPTTQNIIMQLVGIDGEDGLDGVNGLQGQVGKQGFQGIIGLDGIDGEDGLIGPPGLQGLQGITGNSGSGSQGLTPAFILDDNNYDDFNMWVPFRIISASELVTGTLADTRLSSNIPLINADNQFTGLNWFRYRETRLTLTNLVLGSSGGDYPGIGYNFTTTATGANYTYTVTDSASRIEFYNGGFRFKIAASGTAGNAITFTDAAELDLNGKFKINKLSAPNTGAAATCGQLTLVAGTKTINTTAATSTCLIFFQRVANGGTIGFETTYTKVNGVSFTISSDNVLDTSIYNWWLVETH